MSKQGNVAASPRMHDVVWAKVDGYPYWPAVVCRPPKSATPTVKERVHVRFFDKRTSRAWVKIRQTMPFTGSWHRKVPSRPDKDWVHGVAEAVKALDVEPTKRPSLFPPIMECEDEQAGDTSEEEEEDTMKPSAGRRSSSTGPSDSSEGSDIEYKPGKAQSSSSGSSTERVHKNSIPNLPSRKKVLRKKAPKRKHSSPKSSQPAPAAKRPAIRKFRTAASQQANKRAPSPAANSSDEGAAWQLKVDEFLADGKRKDACGRLANDPEFNPRTLRIPENFKAKLPPAMRQWWDIKSENFDSIIFFKVGRMYELYHMDATVGVEKLGLTLKEGKVPHCSVPEKEYGHYSDKLICGGHKVARVEETETPEMAQERCRKMRRPPSKYEQQVRREICRVATKATRTFGPQDGQRGGTEACYLLAIAHQVQEVGGGIAFGICFVDTSVGKFHLGQFTDDHACSRLHTALLCYPPAQVLHEQEHPLPEGLRQILEGPLRSVPREALRPWKEFPDAQRALQQLRDGLYFEEGDEESPQYPEAVAHFMATEDSTHLKPRDDHCLALKALGACTWYLSECRVDLEVLTMRKMDLYVAPDTRWDRDSPAADKRCMVLDAMCLKSLAVLQNSSGGTEGTLLAAMDFCCTPFGKRLFRQWLCTPPCDLKLIREFSVAVENLLTFSNEAKKTHDVLQSLPDLERLLARIHGQGLASKTGTSQPDRRAVLWEEATYNQHRMDTLLEALEAFKRAMQVATVWEPLRTELTSPVLKACVFIGGERLPDLLEALDDIRRAFNKHKKRSLTLSHGVDPDYDAATQSVMKADRALKDYVGMQSRHFGCKVTLASSGERRNQMAVPERAAHLADFTHQLQGQCEGFRYYCTEELKQLATNVARAEVAKEAALKAALRHLSEKFDRRRPLWEQAVQCLSQLDCFLSLATYSRQLGEPTCAPQFLPSKPTGPWVRIKAGRHPCHPQQTDAPCDLCLRSPRSRTAREGLCLLGGQWTLSHQVALLIIVAHLGARVPAEECELTPVDGITVRLGPSSRVTSGGDASSVDLGKADLQSAGIKRTLVLIDG